MVYYGVIDSISGSEGDCASLTFGVTAWGSWNHNAVFSETGLKADNLLSCDVQNTAPAVNDPCEVWLVPQAGAYKTFLMLKTHKLPFKDCG